jgi:RNA polymerase sigma-70 factor (ECF subfamily)
VESVFPRLLGLGNFFSPDLSNEGTTKVPSSQTASDSVGPTPLGDDPDWEYIRWFQEGKEQGFNRLVYRHQDRMYNLCYRMLGDAAAAEEAAQETFLRAYRGLKAFRAEAKFSTWLYRIAVNACLNLRQSAGRRLLRDAAEYEAMQESVADPADGPEAELERSRREALIQAAIRALPEEFRVPLVLRDIEGREYGEIAEITGMNLGTVRSRLHRGRERLRLQLKERSG